LTYINVAPGEAVHRRTWRFTMSYAVLLGRLLFSAIFIVAAPRHFTSEGAAHAASLGVPLARLAVPISGVLALAGGLGVLAGYQTRLSAWMLVAFLVPVTVMMHAFWRLDDPIAVHTQQAMFMKNLAMLGAAFIIAYAGGGPLSLDARMGR
jgi:putative oxidoreductase